MNKLQRLGLAVLLLVPLALQFAAVRSRGIDPDELEHLHAAYSVSQGLVPYRDFFEHHSPGFYFLLQPAFWMLGPNVSVLWLGRFAACGLSCATLVVSWHLAKRLFGIPTAWVSVILLSWSSVFVLKGLELRPDVPACLMITCTVFLALRLFQTARFRDWIGIGFLGGLATLLTQKSVVPVISLAGSVVFARWIDQARTDRRSESHFVGGAAFLGIGLGGAVAWAIAALAFAYVGGGVDFIDATVFQLLRWPLRSERWEQLRPMLASDFILWSGGALSVAILFSECVRRKIEPEKIVLGGTLAGCLVSLASVKAVYPQYVLLWLPLLAISAGSSLVSLSHSQSIRVRFAITGMLLLLCPLECWLLLKGLGGNQASALPHLRSTWNLWGFPVWMALAIPIGLTVWGIVQSRLTRQPGLAVVFLVATGMCYGLFRDVNGWLWTNFDQVRTIEQVNKIAGPEGTVLDGFSGYGALRPHAYYYWWINRYSRALMPHDYQAKLLDILRHRPPKVILYDEELRGLSQLKKQIEADYQPSDPPPIWIRKSK